MSIVKKPEKVMSEFLQSSHLEDAIRAVEEAFKLPSAQSQASKAQASNIGFFGNQTQTSKQSAFKQRLAQALAEKANANKIRTP